MINILKMIFMSVEGNGKVSKTILSLAPLILLANSNIDIHQLSETADTITQEILIIVNAIMSLYYSLRKLIGIIDGEHPAQTSQ